ncbi:MAG: rhomboid family intramembrane serine protease [Bacteroidota bacterium]
MEEKAHVQSSLKPALCFTALLWIIKLLEIGFKADFGRYGTYPRTLYGSLGIITSPLIHGDFYHLLSNSLPILFLGVGLFYFYKPVAWQVVCIIYTLSGFWVWLIAREAYHIGASGLVYGLMAYLLLSGFIRKDRSSIAVSLAILVLYGGSMFTGVLPGDPGISWESHLLGATAGLFCAVLYRKSPIYTVKERELEDESENDTTKIQYEYNYVKDEKGKLTPKKYDYKIDLKKTNDRARFRL